MDLKAAKIYQSFHEINVRVIAANDGRIRAFDGDRIMGVFAGDMKNSNATKASMQIQWGIRNILNPTLETSIRCGLGIDYGVTLVTKVGKGGNPDNSDLVWIGKASNYASHLCNEADNSIIVSRATFGKLADDRKVSNKTEMWQPKILILKNGTQVNCNESSWEWKI